MLLHFLNLESGRVLYAVTETQMFTIEREQDFTVTKLTVFDYDDDDDAEHFSTEDLNKGENPRLFIASKTAGPIDN